MFVHIFILFLNPYRAIRHFEKNDYEVIHLCILKNAYGKLRFM